MFEAVDQATMMNNANPVVKNIVIKSLEIVKWWVRPIYI